MNRREFITLLGGAAAAWPLAAGAHIELQHDVGPPGTFDLGVAGRLRAMASELQTRAAEQLSSNFAASEK